jgi:hypothetical protein
MTARSVAHVYALGRLALGCALVATPSRAARPWLGDAADAPGTRAVVVGFGARDVGIALGTLAALSSARRATGWLRAGMVSDAADLVGTWMERDALPRMAGPGVAAMAAGGVLCSAWLQTQLD